MDYVPYEPRLVLRARPDLRPVAHDVDVLAHLIEIGASREVLRAAVQGLLRLIDANEPAASDLPKKNYSTGLY